MSESEAVQYGRKEEEEDAKDSSYFSYRHNFRPFESNNNSSSTGTDCADEARTIEMKPFLSEESSGRSSTGTTTTTSTTMSTLNRLTSTPSKQQFNGSNRNKKYYDQDEPRIKNTTNSRNHKNNLDQLQLQLQFQLQQQQQQQQNSRRRRKKRSRSRRNKLYKRYSLEGSNKFQSVVEDYSTSHSPLFRHMMTGHRQTEEQISLLKANSFNNHNHNNDYNNVHNHINNIMKGNDRKKRNNNRNSMLWEGLKNAMIPPTIHEVDDEENDDECGHDEDNNYVVEDLLIDPVLGVMDRLEDEIDGHTYDNLLPLPLRVILEEQVFGWSHLCSTLFGHIAFTSLSYLLTFHILNFIFLHKVPTQNQKHHTNNDNNNNMTPTSQTQQQQQQQQQQQPFVSENNDKLCFNSIRCFLYDIADIVFHQDHDNHQNQTTNQLEHTQSKNITSILLHNNSTLLSIDSNETTINNNNNYQNTHANYGNGITLQGNNQWQYEPRWNFISHDKFVFMRLILSILMAISAFRTVRRRRQVWLRYSYGSKEYWQDEATRRKRVKETDRQTILGKIRHTVIQKRNRWLMKRVQRKIQRAESRFEQKKQKEQQLEINNNESSLDYLSTTSSTKNDDTTTQEEEDEWSESETSSVMSILPDDEFFACHAMHYNYALEDLDDNNNLLTEDETSKNLKSSLMSITRDQIRFASGAIENVPYAHGGFFGTAPFMLANPQWIDILRNLMPDVYVELSHRVLHSPVSKLIHWAENNPVVAAYGTAYEILRNPHNPKITPLEWDVFLDPHLVQRLEFVLQQKEKFTKANEYKSITGGRGTNTDEDSGKKEYRKKMKEHEILSTYYDEEIQRRTRVLVEQMLIAHGNLNQLVLEHTGFLKSYNFSRIKRTRRTLGGGIFAMNWCAVYAHALQLGLLPAERELQKSCQTSRTENDSYISSSSHNMPNQSLSSMNIDDSRSQSTIESDADLLIDSDDDDYDDPGRCYNNASAESSIPSCIDKPVILNNPSSLVRSESSSSLISFHNKSQNNNITNSSNNTQSLVSPFHKKPGIKTSVSSTSLNELTLTTCPSWSISESVTLLKSIMARYTNDDRYYDEKKGDEDLKPLSLVLDLKSRHVPKRVWALVVDTLREAGIHVEGIASFNLDEIRDISKYCTSSPLSEYYFFHSAGEIQVACHEGRLQNCRCYFNAGNLLWDKPESKLEYFYNSKEAMMSAMTLKPFDVQEAKRTYKFQSYAKIVDNDTSTSRTEKNIKCNAPKIVFEDGVGSTIQNYKEKFNLSIGVYCQEFAIDDSAISLLVQYVNQNPHVYDLGFSWGGINGVTVRGIQPGRVTKTDGFWNQRYAGVRWNSQLYP